MIYNLGKENYSILEQYIRNYHIMTDVMSVSKFKLKHTSEVIFKSVAKAVEYI